MITLEQFLVVALIVLLSVIVACGVVAVVLLARTLRTENDGEAAKERERTSIPLRQQTKLRWDELKTSATSSKGALLQESASERGVIADEQFAALYEKLLALYSMPRDEQSSEDLERYRRHIEMIDLLARYDFDRSGLQVNQVKDEETPTVKAPDKAFLKRMADGVGQRIGRSMLGRDGESFHDGAPI
jgi:hypothetical protein